MSAFSLTLASEISPRSGLQLTPDSTSRKRTADELAVDSLVTAVTADGPLLISPVSQSTSNGNAPAPKNPLHWKDDGKESNTVQLAEATLRHNPYQSKWGDIASHWNRVLKDLQEKGVIPPDKDYRCLQHKMKSMLDTLRTHHDALKQRHVAIPPPLQMFADAAEREKGSDKKSKKRPSLTNNELASPLQTPPAEMDTIGLTTSDSGVDGTPQSLLMSSGLMSATKENSSKGADRRQELEERDLRIEGALAEQRAQLERERMAYEKKRQELDDARLVRDAQIAEVMKQTLTALTQLGDLLRSV